MSTDPNFHAIRRGTGIIIRGRLDTMDSQATVVVSGEFHAQPSTRAFRVELVSRGGSRVHGATVLDFEDPVPDVPPHVHTLVLILPGGREVSIRSQRRT